MIDWDKGLPLHKFLAFLCRDRDKVEELNSINTTLPNMVTQSLELT